MVLDQSGQSGVKLRSSPHAADRLNAHIGSRIRRRRLALGLNYERVAAQLGWSAAELERYETGDNRISGFDLYRLSFVLNVSIAFFYAETEIAAAGDGLAFEAPNFANTISFRPVQSHPSRPASLAASLAAKIYRIPADELQVSALDFIKSFSSQPEGATNPNRRVG